ncbi:hypothetical protein BDR03DRAFT_108803 [Suillus americanus]|nr:hypothetical protein BDR03DRAFT_108803 [Suillus americanus]
MKSTGALSTDITFRPLLLVSLSFQGTCTRPPSRRFTPISMVNEVCSWVPKLYKVLRANGHTPSEASKETVEEATKSLYLFIGQKGMDYMYNDCSTTSRCGALDWVPISARLSLSSCTRVCETARRPLSLSNSSTA